MQQRNQKEAQFTTELGEILKNLRENNLKYSINQLAYEYDFSKSNISKMERGLYNCKFVTIWKLSEALGIKCSELVKMLEEKLGDDFSLIDE